MPLESRKVSRSPSEIATEFSYSQMVAIISESSSCFILCTSCSSSLRKMPHHEDAAFRRSGFLLFKVAVNRSVHCGCSQSRSCGTERVAPGCHIARLLLYACGFRRCATCLQLDNAFRQAYNLSIKVGTCDVAPKQLKFGSRIEFPAFFYVLIEDSLRHLLHLVKEIAFRFPVDAANDGAGNASSSAYGVRARSQRCDEGFT